MLPLVAEACGFRSPTNGARKGDMMVKLITRIWQSYINREHNERMLKLDNRLAAIKCAVVGRFSRGNIATQWGFYMTEEDLDEQRRKLRDAAFLKQ